MVVFSRTIFSIVLIFLLVITTLQPVLATPATVHISPSSAIKDQTVTLTISVDPKNQQHPNLSVLENNFQILKTSTSSSLRHEKSKTLIRKNWLVLLLPLKKGKLVIPSIKIGNERTPSTSLLVTNKMPKAEIKYSAPNQSPKDIFVEVETDLQEVYVQGQLILTQKIYHSIPLKSANLSPPKTKNNAAEIIPLAKDKPYYWKIQGKRYHVIERSYALFPKRSGALHIEEAEFSGQTKARSASLLSMLEGVDKVKEGSTSQKKVTDRTSAISLTVKPQADSFTDSHWLPAKNITLYGNWSQPPSQVERGEPVTLQLGIIADGLRAEQLPDLQLAIPEGNKSYKEPPELHNNITLTGITGTWSQKITIIPSTAGSLVIPELQLAWWNVLTEQKETTIFNQQVLGVKTNAKKEEATASLSTSPSPDESKPKVAALTNPTENTSKQDTSAPPIPEPTTVIFDKEKLWIPLLLLLSGYFIYKIQERSSLIKKKRSTPTKKESDKTPEHKNDKLILDALKLACLENNPQKAQMLLSQWASLADITPPTLDGISEARNAFLQPEIEQLSRTLYSKTKNQTSSKWNGSNLWKAIQKYPYSNDAKIPKQRVHLQKLYPIEMNTHHT